MTHLTKEERAELRDKAERNLQSLSYDTRGHARVAISLLDALDTAEQRRDRYEAGIRAAMEALSYGKQEQDVVWFSEIETMWDFLAQLVDPENEEDMTRPEREEARGNGQFGAGA